MRFSPGQQRMANSERRLKANGEQLFLLYSDENMHFTKLRFSPGQQLFLLYSEENMHFTKCGFLQANSEWRTANGD